MKYRCKVCGEVISSPVLCPFCGSGSDEIETIDEELDEYAVPLDSNIPYEDGAEANEDSDEEYVTIGDDDDSCEQKDESLIDDLNFNEEEDNVILFDGEDEEVQTNNDENLEIEQDADFVKEETIEQSEEDFDKNENTKDDEKNNETDLEKRVILSENPAEVDYFFKIFGYLYLHDLDKFNKYKTYFDQHIFELLVKEGETIDIDKIDQNMVPNHLKFILNQIKGNKQ